MAGPDKFAYIPVTDGDESIPTTFSQGSRWRRVYSSLGYVIAGLFGAAMTTVILTSLMPPADSALFIDRHCGHSTEEARANGCVFDIFASTWERPECHDVELYEKTWAESPVQWYHDWNLTQLIPREDVARGDFAGKENALYVAPNFHIRHCMYQWERQHRAFIRGEAISEDLWSLGHTHHCGKLAIDLFNSPGVKTETGFSTCRTANAWRKHNDVPA